MESTSSAAAKKSPWGESTPAIGSPPPHAGKASDQDNIDNVPAADQSLVRLIMDSCDLFATPDGTTYVTTFSGDHAEHHRVGGKSFRMFGTKLIYDNTGAPPSKTDLNLLIGVLEAEAYYASRRHPVHIRLAKHNGCIFIDLANDNDGVVKITADGWSVETAREVVEQGVRFIKTSRMAPLPIPVQGGSLAQLRRHVNFASEEEFILFVSWLVGAMQPSGPFPILLLQGEHGSGKSNVARKAGDLIDPSIMPLCSYPRSERDMFIAGQNAWLLNYDNLSGISPILADGFCRLATGGGYATRQLYTDEHEKIFNIKRPLIMNGIENLAGRHDFADRSIPLNTPPISPEERLPESVMDNKWQEDRPGIFGALCDAISTALKNYDKVELDSYPRMADFCRWVCSAEPALPWAAGRFSEAYAVNRREIVEIGLEADLVGSSVMTLLVGKEDWEGTPSRLLSDLSAVIPEQLKRLKEWPKQPNLLSGRLRRAATFLRERKIDVAWVKSGDRKIVISRIKDKVEPGAWTVEITGTPEDIGEGLDFDFDAENSGIPVSESTDDREMERGAV